MHGVFPHGLDQQEVINAILDNLGIVPGGVIAKLVIRRAPLVINIRVAVALPLPLVVALDAPDGLFFEFIHVQYKKRHGYCSGVSMCIRSDRARISPRMASGPSVSARTLFPTSSTARALAGSPTSFGGSICSW